MKTLTIRIALTLLLITHALHAGDLDNQWFKAKLVVKATHFASQTEQDEPVFVDGAATKTLKATFWMHLEESGDDGDHIVSIYTGLGQGGLSLLVETEMSVMNNVFVDLHFGMPVTKKIDGVMTKIGLVSVQTCGKIKTKTKDGELVKATLTSLGGTMQEGSVLLGDATAGWLVGGAKLKAQRVPADKVPAIL